MLEEFWTTEAAIENLRRKHASYISRPGRPGAIDTHGHMWYCFACTRTLSDHRTFNNNEAMWRHLHDKHSDAVDCLTETNLF